MSSHISRVDKSVKKLQGCTQLITRTLFEILRSTRQVSRIQNQINRSSVTSFQLDAQNQSRLQLVSSPNNAGGPNQSRIDRSQWNTFPTSDVLQYDRRSNILSNLINYHLRVDQGCDFLCQSTPLFVVHYLLEHNSIYD